MLELLIILLISGAIILLATQAGPLAVGAFNHLQQKKAVVTEKRLDTMFIQVNKNKIVLFYSITPFLFGIVAFMFNGNFIIIFLAMAAGLALPALVIKKIEAQRKNKLQLQLVDGVMILSSSLKGGLSLIQAIEVLVEEMPAPISQEFGLILRENKMGVSLDESLRQLCDRMKIEELGFLVSSLLVAREAGGDLTKVLSRLATTIRDNSKLKEKVKTLTLQGRMQGMIMSVLPILFIGWVITFNRAHFDFMLNSETGRFLLIIAAVLQVVGMILIHRFSIIKI